METDKTSATQDDQAAVPQAAVPKPADDAEGQASVAEGAGDAGSDMPREINGPRGPEPTRYGDWEQKGRCSDF